TPAHLRLASEHAGPTLREHTSIVQPRPLARPVEGAQRVNHLVEPDFAARPLRLPQPRRRLHRASLAHPRREDRALRGQGEIGILADLHGMLERLRRVQQRIEVATAVASCRHRAEVVRPHSYVLRRTQAGSSGGRRFTLVLADFKSGGSTPSTYGKPLESITDLLAARARPRAPRRPPPPRH